MMKKVFAVICVMCLALIACGEKEEALPIITLRILLSSSAEPQMDVLQQYDESLTESANRYLREEGKEYRVRYQTIQMENEVPAAEELEGADIICTRIVPEDAELYYMDISKELSEGQLQTVYASVPELYWQRVNMNGAIYNLLATPPAVQMIYIDNMIELDSLDLCVPDDLIGQSVENWENYVSDVYNATGKTAYIMPVGYSDSECLVSAGSAWNARFQLILPFLGIDPEQPELGVQCIYESEYGQKIQQLWSKWSEEGYISDGTTALDWMFKSGYDVTAKITDDGQYQYPLQNVTYASPQVGGVNYYSSGISKACEQVDLVCEFLSDLATEENLHEAVIRTEGERVWFHIIPETLIVKDNDQGIYIGTLEENQQTQEERFAVAQMPPAPGFIFDTESVQEEVDAIMQTLSSQNLYGQLKAMEMSGVVPEYAVEIHYIPQQIIDILYEQGMQGIIDEANRQLEEYLNQ